ncbi:LysR family transcriptional regulator [Fischerella sp. JS2]|uniref:LysR family transcriptional regulator n=1 Tax=Fischerella sp. JS2 TaxID=2597771 RepID=UPI0028ECAE1E|nr:LysR family transcriptional regulator [Fischerella sp. JS2]
MDMYQIRYFLAIAETGGFTKAAERLFVSQPSLSAGIKKLEQELGVTLFERGGRRAILTPAGKFFLEKAKTILNEYQVTLRELKGFHHQPTLRLGTLRTIRISSLAGLIRDFQAQHPNMLIELVDGTIEDLRNTLESGDIDLAITVLDNREDPKTSMILYKQRRMLAVPTSHPFAQRGSVRLMELNQQPYIDRLHCELWGETQNLFASKDIQPQVIYKADHEEWVISLIAAGLGMSIMPEWQGIPGVTYIPVLDLPLQRAIGLIWRAKQESVVINKFCAFAASHYWQG